MEETENFRTVYLLRYKTLLGHKYENNLNFHYKLELIGNINKNNEVFFSLISKLNNDNNKEKYFKKLLFEDNEIMQKIKKIINEKKPTSINLTFNSVKHFDKLKKFGNIHNEGKILTTSFLLNNLPYYLFIELDENEDVIIL